MKLKIGIAGLGPYFGAMWAEVFSNYAISGWHGGAQSIRDKRWSFLKAADGVMLREASMELYDRQADPGETNNIFNQHPDVAEMLNRQLQGRLAELTNS